MPDRSRRVSWAWLAVWDCATASDMLFWMLSGDEPQRMVLMPRVRSYEELLRFADPNGRLGGRRVELAKYLDGLGFDFEKWREAERSRP